MLETNKTFVKHDFSHQDLRDAQFEGCNFYDCNFSRSDLRDAQFIDCRFIEQGAVEGCRFDYADLRDASFKQCQLAMGYFVGANCFGIELRGCDLKGANFLKASFVNRVSHQVYFCSAYITGCNLSYVNFEQQCIEKCDLFENRWTGANLQGASFKGSDLSRSEFSEECWGQFSMQNCDLTHTELYGLNIKRVDLSGVKICDWQQEQLLEPLGVVVLPS
ncbi:Qnr family pentapeptide repeat protein [Vibrio genomosp. F6]|uniref:Fluoroquinolone resistance protein n=1 Tax=Vibrio genomosp. F6 str. FF-238 TaxID=1191298 RepID=A0A1E5D4H7_9VIBR|nr:Qnr family pentapeptide repeat protein [Vibrio genomosp. F6]OEE78452.1 fluoroquinolone resistance protein [Vibrio genomosp. F6 str. FF-238]